MKILVTGYSAPQVGSTRAPIKRGSIPQLLVKLLAESHDVMIGKFPEGSNIMQRADLLILFLTPPHNLLGRNALTAMLNAAQRYNQPVLAFFDDWQIDQVVTGHRTIGNHVKVRVERRLKKSNGDDAGYLYGGDKDYQIAHEADIHRVCRIFDGAKPWPSSWHWVVPVFPWGDTDIIRQRLPDSYPADRLWRIDPSALVEELLIPTPQRAPVDRAWSCVSLLDRRDWVAKLNLSWPVRYAGNKRSTTGQRTADMNAKGQLKTEADVQQFASTCKGMLSPSYKKLDGAGWYRSRFQYAANMGAVVYADPLEMRGLAGYGVDSPRDIEEMNDRELMKFADKQANLIEGATWDQRTLKRKLARLLNVITA